MARAKHTDRSAARRRYRVEQTAQPDSVTDDEPIVPNVLRSDARKAAPASALVRPSIMGSFRASFRPLDLRGDLQAAPAIILSPVVLLAIAAAIVSSVAFIVTTDALGKSLDFTQTGTDPFAGKSLDSASNIAFLVVGFFVTPPPAAGAFLVGFFVKRASWLGGFVVGIAAAVCYSVILMSPAGRVLIRDSSPDPFILQAAILAPIGALLFASAAAWYRRFLNLANPNRGQRPPARPKARPAAGRSTSRR